MAAVRVSTVTAEGSDLSGKVGALAIHVTESRNQDYAKLCTYGVGLWKNLHHLLRRSGGGNVKVGWLAVKKQITHASADEVGGVALRTQRECDAGGFTSFVRREVHLFLSIALQTAKRFRAI